MEKSDFASPAEEITYWKNLAKDFKLSLSDARVELDDYQASSRELEAELETQIDQLESKNKELIASNSRLQQEVENLREKLEGQQDAYHHVTEDLQSELAQVRAFKDELQRYIRELEQTNDDLERAKRATVVSLEDFEQRLNMAIERNAFLESELDEKESLAITVQRLKDEARDLRQELDVKVCDRPDCGEFERSAGSLHSSSTVDGIAQTDLAANNDSGESRALSYPNTSVSTSDPSSITPPCTPSGKGLPPMTPGSSPLTTSARISALNIVGDLLRKVGALESKLASCRNFVKDQPGTARNGRIGAPSPLNSPRAKRLNRGATVPSSLKVTT